mgnify:CR=1 FL=1
MFYNFTGKSGLQLPAISLGLWHNFGSVDSYEEATRMILRAFERGVTHFDLANNYGPEPGSAESNFGRILKDNLAAHRDEMIISSKAGYRMWDGPYGDGSSRKYLISSLDQSLKRMGLDYVDIFYSHRYDGVTPIEETAGALVDIVRQGKALYVGLSNYPADKQRELHALLRAAGVPCLIDQYKASMFNDGTLLENLPVSREDGAGFICFSPLAQGLLTARYFNGIPADSRAGRETGFLQLSDVTEERVAVARQLAVIAERNGMTLPQLALAWLLRHDGVTSVIIGASSVRQLDNNLDTLDCPDIPDSEMAVIASLVAQPGIRF